MPASKSSSSAGSGGSGRSRSSGASNASKASARAGAAKTTASGAAAKSASRGSKSTASRRSSGGASTRSPTKPASAVPDGPASLAEQLANQVVKPLGLVLLTRERIQATLDAAAERGRLTRTDANELVYELVQLGKVQTDELLSDVLDRLVRTADRARRTVGVGPSFPILGYDDLTAAQVETRLNGLTAAELRKVREYERRHVNRKLVLDAIERLLA
jgi:polyhydroxyalkanoate synthesis regulator phasin